MIGINHAEKRLGAEFETYTEFCKRMGITCRARLKLAKELDEVRL